MITSTTNIHRLMEHALRAPERVAFQDADQHLNITRSVKTPGQAECRDCRACWWENDTPTKAYEPVLRVLVQG